MLRVRELLPAVLLFGLQMLLDPMGGIVMTNDGNAILREVRASGRGLGLGSGLGCGSAAFSASSRFPSGASAATAGSPLGGTE